VTLVNTIVGVLFAVNARAGVVGTITAAGVVCTCAAVTEDIFSNDEDGVMSTGLVILFVNRLFLLRGVVVLFDMIGADDKRNKLGGVFRFNFDNKLPFEL
jgi:hypothetical protein